MVPLLRKSLLEHQLDTIGLCGISDISLVTGYAAAALRDLGYPCFHNPDFAHTNMVESLFAASALFDGSADLIVAYSDIVYEPRVLRALMEAPADISTVVDVEWQALWAERMDDPRDDAETLKIAADGSLQELGRKPTDLTEIEGQYVGLTKISSAAQGGVVEFYQGLNRDATYDGQPFRNMYMTTFLQRLIDAGHSIFPAYTHGGWLEVDTVSDLQTYEELHQEGRLDVFWRPV